MKAAQSLPALKTFFSPSTFAMVILGCSAFFLKQTSLLPPTSVFASSAQTAAGIVARHVAARGGIQNFRAIHSMKAAGTIRLGGNAPSDIGVLAMRPSFFRVDIYEGDTTITQAYDGKNGWQIQSIQGQGAPESITGDALADLQDQAENAIGGPTLDSVARGNRIELMGEQELDGKPCYKLKITLRSGHSIYQYFDKSTYLEVKEELPRTINGREKLIVETVGDYRKFGGWLFPCSFVSSMDGQETEKLLIQNVEINLPVNETTFHMPAAATATPSPGNPAPQTRTPL